MHISRLFKKDNNFVEIILSNSAKMKNFNNNNKKKISVLATSRSQI